MDFILDNYVYFIVGGIILLMALIGFIAEKTDFGRKIKEPKVKKAKKVEEKPIVAQEPIVENNNTSIEEPTTEIDTEVLKGTENENFETFTNEPTTEQEEYSQNIDAIPLNEDLNVPFGDTPISPIENDNEVIEPLDESFSTDSPAINEVVVDEPEIIDETKNNDIELPEIDSLSGNETKEQKIKDIDEDVWKF